MSTKLDLIAKASAKAPLKRVPPKQNKTIILRANQSFSLTPDIVDLVSSFKKGALSKAVKTALLEADKKGLLDEYKKE